MKDLLIRESDIIKLGRKTIKKVYEFLNDDYILTEFPEMKVQQKKLEEYLVMFCDESKHDKCLKELVDKIQDESLDISLIYDVLKCIKLEFEIDEDLFVENQAFIYFYSVYYLYNDYI